MGALSEIFSRRVELAQGGHGDILLETEPLGNFDPDEARDPTGKWTDGGGGESVSAAEDYKQHGTRAVAFKKWFGDWEHDSANASKVVNDKGEPQETGHISGQGSQVVDSEGKPITVYHGTAHGGFEAFDKAHVSPTDVYGPGFYFTESKDIAEKYTKRHSSDGTEIHTEVKSVYLNIRNPFRLDDYASSQEINRLTESLPKAKADAIKSLISRAGNRQDDVYDALVQEVAGGKAAIPEIMKKAGYDGITHIADGIPGDPSITHRVWIAFEPTQIKATENKGAFSSSDPNIFNFDPEQPRDDSGKWTSEDSTSVKSAHKEGRDTQDMYKLVDGDYLPERQVLHSKIVEAAFVGKTHASHPISYIMGGGPASGKSSLVGHGLLTIPDNVVHVNPDEIKEQMPEFQQMVAAHDVKAGAFVHQESRDIGHMIRSRAAKSGYNILYDGTGDNSIDHLRSQVDAMHRVGQTVEANYVTCDVATALARNLKRGELTGRYVPNSAVKAIHANVSRIVPQAVKEGLFDKFALWDTNGGTPVKVASAEGTNLTIHDHLLWDNFIAKGK